jgi:hypothetical protein
MLVNFCHLHLKKKYYSVVKIWMSSGGGVRTPWTPPYLRHWFGHIMSYIMGNEDKIFEFIDA